MATVVGAYTYRTSRTAPGSGEITLASDPQAGYANTLRVSETDRLGNSRSAQLTAVAIGDVLSVDVEGGLLLPTIVTSKADSGTYYSFGFTVRNSYIEDYEPPNNTDVTLYAGTGVAWPTVAELAQLLNLPTGTPTTTWNTFLTKTLASAIQVTKGQVGNWDDSTTVPNTQLSAAALRMAELMGERPDATVESLLADATFSAHMAGQHKRFPFA